MAFMLHVYCHRVLLILDSCWLRNVFVLQSCCGQVVFVSHSYYARGVWTLYLYCARIVLVMYPHWCSIRSVFALNVYCIGMVLQMCSYSCSCCIRNAVVVALAFALYSCCVRIVVCTVSNVYPHCLTIRVGLLSYCIRSVLEFGLYYIRDVSLLLYTCLRCARVVRTLI